MSFFAWSSIIEALLKLCLAFTIVYISFDKLELYALLMLFVSVVITFGTIFLQVSIYRN